MSFRGGSRGGGRGGSGGFRGGRGGGFQQRDMGPPAQVLGMGKNNPFFSFWNFFFFFFLFLFLLFLLFQLGGWKEDVATVP